MMDRSGSICALPGRMVSSVYPDRRRQFGRIDRCGRCGGHHAFEWQHNQRDGRIAGPQHFERAQSRYDRKQLGHGTEQQRARSRGRDAR